jgi:hypothetical protein
MEATATITNTVPIVADFGSGNAIEITDGAQVTATSVDVYVLSAKSGAIRIADSGINPDTGPKSGNTPVTVTGTNLSGVTKIQHPATRQISHCLSAGYTSYNPETGR